MRLKTSDNYIPTGKLFCIEIPQTLFIRVGLRETIILQKGKDAFDLFVTALQSEKLHIGHKSLAETLQVAKKEFKKPRPPSRTMFFTPPCPRTNRFTQHTPALLAQVKPRRRRKSTGGDRQISESG